jgi:aldehyde dehydrogenase
VAGASYDNNLLCTAEKEVFAVEAIFDSLLEAMARHRAVQLTAGQVEALTSVAFVSADGDRKTRVVNKDLLGKDAAVLARHAGITVPQDTLLLFGETDESNPFVDHEQMMPFVPFVRVRDVDTAIGLAQKYEHGFKHTAIIHSRNLEAITRMGRVLDTTVFVQNGPCMAGNGGGGEGYMSYTIATPTGEGITTPLTFTRQRRSATVGTMRVL